MNGDSRKKFSGKGFIELTSGKMDEIFRNCEKKVLT